MGEELIITEEGFPHSAKCMDCGRELQNGMPYSKRLIGLSGESWPIIEVVCVPCGMGLPGDDGDDMYWYLS